MSTRSTIYVLTDDPKSGVHNLVKVYKHWDGHPESTLEWLKDFNKSFSTERGDDPEYKLASLLRSSAFDCHKYRLDDSRHKGWGVVTINSDCNEEYEYYLHPDGSVTYLAVERHYQCV